MQQLAVLRMASKPLTKEQMFSDNLDSQLLVQHVKLEVGVKMFGQSFPLRLLETRKPTKQ